MQNTTPQITEKQRKGNLLSYILITTLACLYGGMRMGYFYATNPDATLLTAFMDFVDNWSVEPWKIFPTNILCVGMFVMAAAIIDVLLYNKYLITKDTVEYAHGDARFETNYDQYEKEFVVDPAVVSEMKGVTMTDKNCPRNEEGKKVYKGIKRTQDSNVKYHDVIEECRRRSMVYTDTIYLSLNGSWSQRNTNSIVFGASGTGKSRYFLKPNILQANSSIICTDPSGDVMQATGYFLEKIMGYDVRCFNIEDMTKSCRFNPLYYIRDTKDIAIIVNTFLENINGEKKSSGGGDGDFWTQAAKALLCGVIGYLYEVCPPEQRNFSNVLDVIRMDGRSEGDDATVETDFDTLFTRLGEANPASYAYQQYCIFKQAPAKTRLNILISTSVNLSQMDIPEVKNLTYKDELDLDMVGERKMAIFLIIPQADTTYTWLTAMFYSLLFKRLYSYGEKRMKDSAIAAERGDIDPETGKPVKALSDPQMKVPVRFLIDECRNIGKIPNLSIYLATCRKYRISIVPIFQNYSQIEELYGKEGANSIVSNCDAFLFLGGSDESTLKIIQGHLGKETVKTLSNSMAQSAKGSNSANKQQTGKDLMTRDQIETMSNAECLLFIRALRPFKTKKYDLNRHPNYKYLNEGKDGKAFPNPFSIEYEDEAIEANRVRTADEEGYIEPEIVDSARRRTLIASNKKKVAECHGLINDLNKQLENCKSDKEKEKLQASINTVKEEIKKLERTDPDKNDGSTESKVKCGAGRSITKHESDPMPESNETKSAEQYQKDMKNENVPQINSDLSDVVNSETVGSYSAAYEFDRAEDFNIDVLLGRTQADGADETAADDDSTNDANDSSDDDAINGGTDDAINGGIEAADDAAEQDVSAEVEAAAQAAANAAAESTLDNEFPSDTPDEDMSSEYEDTFEADENYSESDNYTDDDVIDEIAGNEEQAANTESPSNKPMNPIDDVVDTCAADN